MPMLCCVYSFFSQTRAPEGHMSRKKHQMTDVPDPPLDVGGIMVTAYQQVIMTVLVCIPIVYSLYVSQAILQVKKAKRRSGYSWGRSG